MQPARLCRALSCQGIWDSRVKSSGNSSSCVQGLSLQTGFQKKDSEVCSELAATALTPSEPFVNPLQTLNTVGGVLYFYKWDKQNYIRKCCSFTFFPPPPHTEGSEIGFPLGLMLPSEVSRGRHQQCCSQVSAAGLARLLLPPSSVWWLLVQ